MDLFSRFNAIREVANWSWRTRPEKAFAAADRYVSASLLRGVAQDFAAHILEGMEKGRLDFVTRFAQFGPELDYIQTHGLATTTVTRLAEIRGVRREVFSRNFARATGISPKQFLMRSLLNRACVLLLGGNRQVREVAFELGFANEFYFSRFFKKHIGIPPNKYRATHMR